MQLHIHTNRNAQCTYEYEYKHKYGYKYKDEPTENNTTTTATTTPSTTATTTTNPNANTSTNTDTHENTNATANTNKHMRHLFRIRAMWLRASAFRGVTGFQFAGELKTREVEMRVVPLFSCELGVNAYACCVVKCGPVGRTFENVHLQENSAVGN